MTRFSIAILLSLAGAGVSCRAAEDGLYIDPAALPPGLALVDVRPPEAFAAARIPASVNVPLFAVKARAGLRGGALLVDKGLPSLALERECARLRAQGWRIAILRGGLARWRSLGLPLEGAPHAAAAAILASPSEILAAAGAARWLLVDAGDGKNRPAEAVPLPSGRSFAERLAGLLAARKDDAESVLVVGARPEDRDAPWKGDALVFHLDGGWERFREAASWNAAVLAPGQGRTSSRAEEEAGCSGCR